MIYQERWSGRALHHREQCFVTIIVELLVHGNNKKSILVLFKNSLQTTALEETLNFTLRLVKIKRTFPHPHSQILRDAVKSLALEPAMSQSGKEARSGEHVAPRPPVF